MELKEQLEALTLKLEGKSKEEVKTAIDNFSTEFKSQIDEKLGEQKTEFAEELKKIQDHANALDVKLKEQKTIQKSEGDAIKNAITENFSEIKGVKKGNRVDFEIKAVGNMTLPVNLTGDQPRSYSTTVAGVPAQKVNFEDLVTTIPIDGGTYTFPRETGSEGGIGTQTEGADKSQIDYDLTMVDVNTDFIAGYCVYSKKMANNLPFLQNFLPVALRRDYFKNENADFYADLVTNSTASALTSGNVVERIVNEQVTLMANDFSPNAIVVNSKNYGEILLTAGSSGTGDYSLPGVVTIVNGVVTINGLSVVVASWMPADKYIIGDWAMANKIVTEGLGLGFFEQDGDNVKKNNITGRIESQTALAVLRTDAFINGDFTTVV